MKPPLALLVFAALAAIPHGVTMADDATSQPDPVLVRYDFSDAGEPVAPSETAAGLEASKLAFGQTIADAFDKVPPAAVFTPEGELSIRSDSLPQGVGSEGEHYVAFTLKSPKGKAYAITGVSLVARRSANKPDLYVYPRIKSSFDDYGAVISIGQIKGAEPAVFRQEINGLPLEDEVTIRLYLPAINRGANRVIIDEISLSGHPVSR